MFLPVLVPAVAGAATVGAGLSVATDLADTSTVDGIEVSTRFPVALALRVPVDFAVSEHASVRVAPRLESALTGQSVLTFSPDDRITVLDESETAWYAALGAVVGPAVRIGDGGWSPVLAGGVGAVLAGTFHNLDRCPYFQDFTDLEGCSADGTRTVLLDPYTLQPALAAEFSVGVQVRPEDEGLGGFVELGYGSVGLAEAGFVGGAEGLRRAPYAYNTVQLSLGLLFGVER